jgi:cytochrome c
LDVFRIKYWIVAGLLPATISFLPSQLRAADGAKLFEPCRACHSLDPSAKGTAGPSLSGLIGRRFAGDRAFDYSPVLRQAGASGAQWTRERLDQFLEDPEAMFPAMWMSSRPMPDAAERKALTDFLADPKSR